VVRPAWIFALALPLLAGSSSAANRPVLANPHPCGDAPGFTCLTLAVPLDHGGRMPGTLSLQVAVQDVAPRRGVLLFLTGGPGQPGAPFGARVSQRLGAAVDGYRLVLIDQRGTGSLALHCPRLQQRMGSSDLAVPTRAEVTGCASAIGPKRRFFGTDQTVQDIDALGRALGVQKLTLDGVSYGSFVAERYALRYPHRVARLVLDSVVPHVGINGLSVENASAVGRVLRAVCGERHCPGDPATDLAAVVRGSGIATGLLDALVTMSVIDPTYPGVPEALHAARQGNRGDLDALIGRYGPDPRTPAEALSQGLHASALCADNPMPWGDAATPVAQRLPALRRAVARIPGAALWPFDRTVASGNGIVRTCLYWPPEPAPQVPHGDLPAVPTLLLAGDHDLSTPLAWARQEAARAPGGRLVVVPGAGHSVQMRALSDRGREAVREFLQAGPRTVAGAPPVEPCVPAAVRRKAIAFRSTDGIPLSGVVFGSGSNGIVLSHEFRANLCNWVPFAQTLAARGYRVLVYDSRPLASTAAVRAHLERDVLGAERALVRLGVRRVLLGGASAGGTAAMTAAALAPRSRLAGVVVLSSPTRFGAMDAESAARRVTAPSFYAAGRRDSGFVDEIRKMYAASAGKPKRLAIVDSSGHGTQLLDPSWAPPSFRTKLLKFIVAAFRR
jgi:pimeloyl-ACP methyl ester carboxylesterase